MPRPASAGASTRRAAVYRALLDAHAIADWKVPTGMTSKLPPGLPPAGNEKGWREALDKLAALVETERERSSNK